MIWYTVTGISLDRFSWEITLQIGQDIILRVNFPFAFLARFFPEDEIRFRSFALELSDMRNTTYNLVLTFL